MVDRVAGALFGSAYGDALGRTTEFQSYAEIAARYGPGGPRELTGSPALVTDDTQMALAVAWAVHGVRPDPATLERRLRERATDAELIREARELGYVLPGERLFIVKGITGWQRARARERARHGE